MKKSMCTYKWKDSLNLGLRLFDLLLVECFRFLSCRWGPIKLISTNGRNIPPWITHFRSFAATTGDVVKEHKETCVNCSLLHWSSIKRILTLYSNFVFSRSRMSEQVDLNRHLAHAVLGILWIYIRVQGRLVNWLSRDWGLCIRVRQNLMCVYGLLYISRSRNLYTSK